MESSKLPFRKWAIALYLCSTNLKGEAPRMLLCFANRFCGRVGEPFLVSGGELVVVVEASFEEREEGGVDLEVFGGGGEG